MSGRLLPAVFLWGLTWPAPPPYLRYKGRGEYHG